MELVRLITFGCLLSTVSATAAAQPVKSVGAIADKRPVATSQSLSRAVFLQSMDGEFGKIDSNKDGKATRFEVEGFERANSLSQDQARNRSLFARLDTDQDGHLSQAEFARMALAPTAPKPEPMLKRFDLNGDASISLVEYRTGTLANFDRMDIDKDGFVSAAEMKAAGIRK